MNTFLEFKPIIVSLVRYVAIPVMKNIFEAAYIDKLLTAIKCAVKGWFYFPLRQASILYVGKTISRRRFLAARSLYIDVLIIPIT